MTHDVLIRLARLINADALRDIDDGKIPAQRYVQRGGLRLREEGVPLLVDHDRSRRVGTVYRVLEFADTTGLWVWAKATVEDPPGWLRAGTRASYGSHAIHQSDRGWKHSSFVSEVSVLSSDHEPVEPLACVARLERSTSSPAAGTSDRLAAGDTVIYHQPGERIVRYGVGKVLGVR